MKVDIYFGQTADPGVYLVMRKGFLIGKVMNDTIAGKWIFKHIAVDHLLFVEDTREDAVSIYYKIFGGTNNGRMESCRFSEECHV